MISTLSHLKTKALELRRAGHSYGYIKKTLGLKSKGTISYWLKDVPLSKESKKKLARNIELATERGLFAFNKNRTEKIKKENKLTVERGVKTIPKNLSRRDLLLIGTALYWGEGTKAWKEGSYPRFSFSNSDPKMIGVCMRFLREILKVEESKIYGSIHLYPNTDISASKDFWEKITGLCKEKFYIIHQVSRAGQNLRKNILPYGTMHIRTNNRLVFYKVKGLIDGLIKGLEIY